MSGFAPRYLYAVGDGMANSDYTDWMRLSDELCFLQEFAWQAGDEEDGTPGQGSATLFLQARDGQALDRMRNEMERQFHQSRRAAQAGGPRVRGTIGCLRTPTDWRYLDVTDIRATSAPAIGYSGRDLSWPVTFTTLPYARSHAIPYPVSATLTNGVNSSRYFQNVPGTAPALLWLVITDVSTGGVFIQRLRIGVVSDRYLEAATFPAIIDAAARAPGTSGSGVISLVLTDAWQDVADLALDWRGALMFLLRARDTATASAPFNLLRFDTASAGTMPPGAYTFIGAAMDSSSQVLAYSAPRTFTLPISNRKIVAYFPAITGVGAPDYYRLYWTRDGNDWIYKAQGSSSTTFTLTNETSAITADPPTSADLAIANAELRAVLRTASGALIRTLPPVAFKVSNNVYEPVKLYEGDSPIPRGEGALPENWMLGVQAKSGGSNTPTVSIDLAMPFPAGYGEYAEVWWPETTPLAALREWNLVPDRAGYQSAYLSNSGVEAGRLGFTPDALRIGPGAALLTLQGDIAGSVFDTSAAKFTVLPTITPRWRGI